MRRRGAENDTTELKDREEASVSVGDAAYRCSRPFVEDEGL